MPITQATVIHDLLPLRFPPEYPRQQYYFRYLVPRILHRSRHVIADSESTRRDVVQHYGVPLAKTRVIFPGYDPSAFFHDGLCPGPDVPEERLGKEIGMLFSGSRERGFFTEVVQSSSNQSFHGCRTRPFGSRFPALAAALPASPRDVARPQRVRRCRALERGPGRLSDE